MILLKLTTIGRTCQVGDGNHSTIARQNFGVLYLTSKNFKDGKLDLNKVCYISENDYSKHFDGASKALSKPEKDDLVFSIIGTLGEPYLVRGTDRFGLSSSVAIVRPRRSILDPRYLLYWSKSPIFQNKLYGIKGGVAQGYVSLEMLRSLPVPELSILVQRRIADILSTYDDLIENNTRRIKILEEMARLIYREWFIEFKAPGIKLRKASPEEKKVTGKDVFPEEWEIGIVNDLLSLKSGFAFKSGKFIDNGRYGLVTIKNVQDGSFNPETTSRLDELTESMPDYCIIETGDILMSLTGNIGRVCLTYGSDLLLNQRVSKIVPLRKEDNAISYCLFRQTEMQRKLEMISNGVAQQNLSPIETGKLVITIPSKEIRDEFHKVVTPLLKMIIQMYQANSNLRQTRDLLLPKLISGEVEV